MEHMHWSCVFYCNKAQTGDQGTGSEPRHVINTATASLLIASHRSAAVSSSITVPGFFRSRTDHTHFKRDSEEVTY
ncbi:hypothetical protein MHYP_G00065230 [Metynnis hypsauchen]